VTAESHATPKRADAAFADKPAFGVDEAIKRLAELAPEARVAAPPEFADRAPTLGTDTKLADASAHDREDASAPDRQAEANRAVAPVSVAIDRPLDASAATHVRRALATAREGDRALTLTHLALAGVGRLDEPREDARRLFVADGLMKAGVAPSQRAGDPWRAASSRDQRRFNEANKPWA
jgi:hypothetical protein